MAKTYLMGDGELSDEQRESVHKFTEEQNLKAKELAEKAVAKDLEVKRYTLEELLKTRMKPEEDRVIIYPDPVELMTAGGLYKSDETVKAERPVTGTVVAVGPGKPYQDSGSTMVLLRLLSAMERRDSRDYGLKETINALKHQQSSLKPGDRVMYGRYAGTPAKDPFTGAEILIMRPGDIFVKI